jgi:hypothetical protein
MNRDDVLDRKPADFADGGMMTFHDQSQIRHTNSHHTDTFRGDGSSPAGPAMTAVAHSANRLVTRPTRGLTRHTAGSTVPR